ncbi:MAG TPA: type IV secretion system DNA-binding domain-containing protein [Solirubrobacteraceae bacterium]|nr:type IV secretion system DNA-binding domain-containing protein [Solirubrobacteraceae bacterium]
MREFEDIIAVLAISLVISVVGGVLLAWVLRRRGLRWTWALLGLPAAVVLSGSGPVVFWTLVWSSLLACGLGAHWHRMDLHEGVDHAEAAHRRIGITTVIRRVWERQRISRWGWLHEGRLIVGRDPRGLAVSIPVGFESGSHMLVLGATGSGKTVTEAWITGRLIEAGHGAVVIDPKGDPLLADELEATAARAGKAFLAWTPQGRLAYNPYANGSDSEIADKALSGERYSEPHYLRQAQRYLGHAVRSMHAAGVAVTPVSLMAHMNPRELEVTARQLPEADAAQVQAYLDSLGERQRRELAGIRDRLSILAESELRDQLNPTEGNRLDVHQAVAERAVVYFRLDADRWPLLAQMLAAAIVGDLISLVARMQARPTPTLVVIDEFSATAAEQVSRLFGRARSAGVSLLLATQELADLQTVGDGALREQTLGNVETVIAHRQNVPESAELIAAMAGTRPAWVTTQQTEEALIGIAPSGRGTRRRGYEFHTHPSHIKQLPTGHATIITPGTRRPTSALIHHPRETRL